MAKVDKSLQAIREIEFTLALRRAAVDLIEFAKLLSPDFEARARGDLTATTYNASGFHRFIASQIMEMCDKAVDYSRARRNLAFAVPPQHGKTQLCSIFFIAWWWGRNPSKNIIFGTYNETYAVNIGRKVKSILQDPIYKKIFPSFELKEDSQSSELIGSSQGGQIVFIGRKGSGTGKPGDLVVVDDPIKDRQEARSATVMEEVWSFFTDTISTRIHDRSIVVVIHTRWIVNDLIGRLVDPSNDTFDPKIARRWRYINIPAVNFDPELAERLGQKLEIPTDPDVIEEFGPYPMAALWPEKFSLEFFAGQKRLAPASFNALRQGNPTPEDGVHFTKEMLTEYQSTADLPDDLTIYGASDHSTSEKTTADSSVVGIIGVDAKGHIWILPDLYWKKNKPAELIDAIIAKIAKYRPIHWFGDDDATGRAIEPALNARMEDMKTYCPIYHVPTHKDKLVKVASIHAMASFGKVHFPAFAPWWQKAKGQILKFPVDAHDDFVDMLGIVGRGLEWLARASKREDEKKKVDPLSFDGIVKRAANSNSDPTLRYEDSL